MKRLIVNADDFGMTHGVNRAILELHRRGVLSSATLMATAEAKHEASSAALECPGLGVGCHVVLVDGHPALPAAQLPTLVEARTGRLRPTLGQFVQDLMLGRIRGSEIQAEAEAQIGILRALGIAPTHLDTHKHTHMFPRVLAPLLAAAKRCGVGAIRNPFEPAWSQAATARAPWLRRMQVRMLNRFQPEFRRQTKQAGLATTDGAIGVLATGTLDTATVSSLLSAMPDGVWELVTHPGYNDAHLVRARTRLLASREVEMHALESLTSFSDFELIHFGQLSAKA